MDIPFRQIPYDAPTFESMLAPDAPIVAPQELPDTKHCKLIILGDNISENTSDNISDNIGGTYNGTKSIASTNTPAPPTGEKDVSARDDSLHLFTPTLSSSNPEKIQEDTITVPPNKEHDSSDIISNNADRPRTARQKIVDSICEIEYAMGKVKAEGLEKRRRALLKRPTDQNEKLLKELTGISAGVISKTQAPPKTPGVTRENAADFLYMMNMMAAGVIEDTSIKLHEVYPDVIPTDLEGYEAELKKNEAMLRKALKGVAEQHFEIIERVMTPMAVLITVNIVPMLSVATKNLKKKSTKPISTLSEEIKNLNGSSK